MNRAALLPLLAVSLMRLSFAQSPPALAVVPSKVTMLVGETHTFRAVGKDGRIRHNVRWSVSPEHAAKLTMDGDEATLNAVEPSSNVMLTAYFAGDSAEAGIEIRAGGNLSPGTALWSVTNLPGCKTTKITPAVPSANGPDIYVEEDCPTGMFVRALTADGRELWRRRIGGLAVPDPAERETNAEALPSEHLKLNARSSCDAISPGMSKEAVSKLAQARSLRLPELEQRNRNWIVEEDGFRCNLSFDDAGRVVKQKKTIVTD
jgi:hypothetical protein